MRYIRTIFFGLILVFLIHLGGCTTEPAGLTGEQDGSSPPVHANYEQAVVFVLNGEGDQLGKLNVAVARDPAKRYRGLSDTRVLPEGRGMLFVYKETKPRTFTMREMSFGIDIIYIDGNREITSIHHARAPEAGENGNKQRYQGTGRYVLEANYEWAKESGIKPGHRVRLEGL